MVLGNGLDLHLTRDCSPGQKGQGRARGLVQISSRVALDEKKMKLLFFLYKHWVHPISSLWRLLDDSYKAIMEISVLSAL